MVCEWTLGLYMQDYPEVIQAVKNHWETWVTEEDVVKMSVIGFTHVRIPIGKYLKISHDIRILGGADASRVGSIQRTFFDGSMACLGESIGMVQKVQYQSLNRPSWRPRKSKWLGQ